MKETRERFALDGALAFGLAVAAAVAFGAVIQCDFVNFDDPIYVTENEKVQEGLKPANIPWALTYAYGHWIPLDTLSHMLDCELFGMNAAGHHATSLFFHCCNVVLLFALLRWMTGARWRSALAAGLFALHPLSVEPVAWISSRKDVLSTCLALLCLLCYVRYVRRPSVGAYIGALALFVLALIAKPMVMTLPALMILMDYWPLRRFSLEAIAPRALWAELRRPLLEKGPFLAVAAAFVVFAFVTQEEVGALARGENCPFSVRVGNALVSYVVYLRRIVWPVDLAPFYPHPGFAVGLWRPIAAGLLLVGLTTVSVGFGRRLRYLPVGWLWYGVALFPVSSLVVQLGSHAMADRYGYVPLIGAYIIVAWGLGDLVVWRPALRTPIVAVSVAALSVFSALAFAQVRHWRDSEALFLHTLRVTKSNYLAHKNLGVALAAREDHAGAIQQYLEAARIRSDDADLYYNAGNAYTELGRPDEAIRHFLKALETKPDHVEAHYNVANALAQSGRLDEAVPHYERVLAQEPDHVGACVNLGNTLALKGELEAAADRFRAAARLEPDAPDPYINLANVLSQMKQFDAAVENYRKALALEPDNGTTHANLSMALAGAGRMDEAADACRKALELNPGDAGARERLRRIEALRTQQGAANP